MLSPRRQRNRTRPTSGISPLGRPGARYASNDFANNTLSNDFSGVTHSLTDKHENDRLFTYESNVKKAFDNIVPTLKTVSALQHETDFEQRAQTIIRTELGYSLPDSMLANAWVNDLNVKNIFSWCMFETYKRFSDDFYTSNPLGISNDQDFQQFIESCGFHTVDVSPCADGRLAHVIRYVLRFPYKGVRRRSYAGALFDIENSLDKWVEVELARFREGKPNTADEPTRYLKVAVYHHSSVDPAHQGCAAHGSDDSAAAKAGVERLNAFKQAIENTHCCGASIDCLLIGLDTDTDAIRVHFPNANGEIDTTEWLDGMQVFNSTRHMQSADAVRWIEERVNTLSTYSSDGMAKFISQAICNNLSQIDYVISYSGGHYKDIGHAERFVGVGIGFEEVQLRNLTYFAYMNTVEEATGDLDIGLKIFKKLNLNNGLPVPIVVRFDYHSNVPGSKSRAVERCERVACAIHQRYKTVAERGLLHTLQAVRDVTNNSKIEILSSSVDSSIVQEYC